MKKATTIILLILAITLLSACTQEESTEITGEATTDFSCPRRIEHDPYPGTCYLYVDADSNDVYDLSE